MSSFPTELFVNGELRPGASGATIPQTNPATEAVFAQVECASLADINEAVDGADSAFDRVWRDMAPGKRSEILFAVAVKIRAHGETLAQLECDNIGKPITDARGEIELGARVFEYYAGAIGKFFGQTIPVAGGGLDFTLREPMGVVAAIVPWNFPFPIACWKAAPALAAGNSVVLKPASQSPLTAIMLGQLAFEAGLPAGVLQVVHGAGREVGAVLVTHPHIRKISFTGSTEVGAQIMELAAKDIKRVSLELGGKSPNIVFADSDLKQASQESPMSVFANTGQDCGARSRAFVERRVFDEFVEGFVTATKTLKIGDPAMASTQIGPLVSDEQRRLVETFIEEAESAGRTVACGGGRPLEKGFFLEPTVILEPDPADRCWRDEIFGPVVCIRAFDDEKTMLDEVNDTPYGLSGSIWTNDLRRAIRVAKRVESGVLGINTNSSVHVEAPFGGFKQSGIGRDLGMSAMEGYTEIKNVYIAEG